MNRKAGYSGHDSMRENAVKAFAGEMHGLNNMSRDCFKSGGRVRRNMGGMMTPPENTADSIQQANNILSSAASNGVGLKRGGKAMHGMRHKHADGGPMDAMGTRDFMAGKSAMGLKCGGGMHKHEMGGEVKRAIGGVGKIRHGQMTRAGAQIAPRGRHKG